MGMAQEVNIPGKYHWKKRIVIVYADSDSSFTYQKQLQEFENHKKGMVDRDLVVFSVFHQKIVTPTGEVADGSEAQRLRQQYEIADKGLSVVLIGKDGGEKLTKSEFLSAGELFGTIDQMPMRKTEMKNERSG